MDGVINGYLYKLVIPLLFFSMDLYGQNGNALDTTFVNNKTEIRVFTRNIDDQLISISSIIGGYQNLFDTLELGPLCNIEFVNFDDDSNPDIMTTFLGHNPFYNLYIFNIEKSQFVKIKNYWRFPDSKIVEGQTNLYYSYHSAGCADANWVSDLWKIENFKIIHLGHLYG